MAYSTNPNLPKARAIALKLLLQDGLSPGVVARKCGVHRTTLYRWRRKWDELNMNMQRDNPNRPTRLKTARYHGYHWSIPTTSSRPLHCPHAVSDELLRLVLDIRQKIRRCAEVVWHYLKHTIGVSISLSSVKRILRRHHCFDGAKKPRLRRDNPRRPLVTRPGELVQTDTIHHVDPATGGRLYYYTVMDLYTRMAYVAVSSRILPGQAAKAVLTAQQAFGFRFAMVQSDNGPEYGRYFEDQLRRQGITVRHSRLHRPNDNAHIERFNRTIQEECIGSHWKRSVPLRLQQQKLNEYLDYYNNDRVHLGIQLRTPQQMLQSS